MRKITEERGFWDGHVHSNRSDGRLSPDEVAQKAVRESVRVFALTDHNRLDLSLAEELSRRYPVTVIPACEFSSNIRFTGDDREHEIHIIGLFLRETEEIRHILERNQVDRKPYLMAFLRKLDALGMDMSGDGSHDLDLALTRLLEENHDSAHVGRQAIARRMVKLGYVESVQEAFYRYIGRKEGELRLAYVSAEEFLHYAPFEDVVRAILSCPGAIAVLCHPFYMLDGHPGWTEELVSRFADLGGQAMEVWYGTGEDAYTPEQTATLLRLSERFGLLPTASSDCHSAKTPLMRGDTALFDALNALHLKLLSESEQKQTPGA